MILNEPTPEQLQAIDSSLSEGNMLEAIKQYRTVTSASLAEAKEWAEQRVRTLRHAHPEKFPAAEGSNRAVVMTMAALALTAVAMAVLVLR